MPTKQTSTVERTGAGGGVTYARTPIGRQISTPMRGTESTPRLHLVQAYQRTRRGE